MTMRILLTFFTLIIFGLTTKAQNWQSLYGGNSKNNFSPHFGIQNTNIPLWTVQNASQASLGGNTYSHGDYFVTTRWNINQGRSVIECRDLLTGNLIWTSPNLGAASKLHAVAFNEDAVYAHDYDDSSRMFYALNPQNGSILWSVPSYTFGPLDSPIFDCEGNPIINTSLNEFNVDASLVHCINKTTGAIIWTVQEFVVLLPNKLKAAHENTLYMISGSAVDPKRLVAIDMTNGQILYYSNPIPGQASQHIHPIIGKDGVIYVVRDGGNVFSFTDTRTGFTLNWQYAPVNFSLSTVPAIDQDGHFLFIDGGRVTRLDKNTGTVLAQSNNHIYAPESSLMVSRDGIVHINNRNGGFFALSANLQSQLWSYSPGGGNYYSFPHLSAQGIMISAGSGTTITAFQRSGTLSPVADFQALLFQVNAGTAIQFNDKSSNGPTTWSWSFDGGTPNTSTQQNPIITYHQAGVYNVTLIATNSNGVDTVTKSCYIKVDGSLMVAKVSHKQSIQVYPNPFEDRLFFRWGTDDLSLTYSLYDSFGKQISRFTITRDNNSFDLSHLRPGFYFLQSSDLRFESIKILKK
jgi:PKD repeat protein